MLDDSGSQSLPITFVCGNTRLRYSYLNRLLNTARLLLVDFGQQDTSFVRMQARLMIEQQRQNVLDLANVDYVVLEGCDILDDHTLTEFVDKLLLPKCQVILFYEHLPEALLIYPPWQGQVTLVGVSLVLPLTGTAHKIPIKVQALRRGHVYLGNRLITHWRGDLQRDLFYFFADCKVIDKERVIENFWSHLPYRKATNNFFGTLLKLKNLLGFKVIDRRADKRYGIIPDVLLQYDVDDFIEAIETAMLTQGQQQIDLLEKALALYQVDFLETLDAAWVIQRRQALMIKAVQALLILAQHYAVSHHPKKAVGYLARAFHINRQDERVTSELMQLYNQQNLPCDALEVYGHWLNATAGQPGKLPGAKLQELAKEALAQCNS